jgi:hypothetical protein
LHIVATISFEQYTAALSAMRKNYQQRVRKTGWLAMFFVAILCFSLAIALKTSVSRDFTLGIYFVLVTLYVWSKLRAKSCLKQVYEAQKKQLNGQQMDINEAGISGQWEDGHATYQDQWSAFQNFAELPDALLFFPNSVSFVRIPKESLSAEDQLEIKRWAKNSIR